MGLLRKLRNRWRRREKYRKIRRACHAWRSENPEASFAEFYVLNAMERIRTGQSPPLTLGLGITQHLGVRRAERTVDWFRATGLAPCHVCVDYGCGTLWIGEALMTYLEPENYVGMDVTDHFYTEGLTRLAPEFVAVRRPMLRVISEQSLDEVKSRKPDFLFSTAVLMHVPPSEMDDFFAKLTYMATPKSRIFVEHGTAPWSRGISPHKWPWWHSRRVIRASLARLGYTARFPGLRAGMLRQQQMFEILPNQRTT